MALLPQLLLDLECGDILFDGCCCLMVLLGFDLPALLQHCYLVAPLGHLALCVLLVSALAMYGSCSQAFVVVQLLLSLHFRGLGVLQYLLGVKLVTLALLFEVGQLLVFA